MKQKAHVVIPKQKLGEFCKRHHICRLSLFGSVLREDFGPGSDVDVLVEFGSGHVPGFFGLFDMEEELSILQGVKKVDLRTPEDLSRYFRSEVVSTAEVYYAEG